MKLKNIIGSLTAKFAALALATVCTTGAWALTVEGLELPKMQATILDTTDEEFPNSNLNELTQPLDHAVHFAIPLTAEQQTALNGKYFVDFVLKVNKDVLLVDPAAIMPQIQNGSLTVEQAAAMPAGCIVGAVNPSNPWWIAVPTMGQMQLSANTPYRVCSDMAAQGTINWTLQVGPGSLWGENESGFLCGIWFTPGFHAANPDLVITLEPRLYKYNPEDQANPVDMGSLGDTLRFPQLPKATVNVKDAAGLAEMLGTTEEEAAERLSDLGTDWITRFSYENGEPTLYSLSGRTYTTSTESVFVFKAAEESKTEDMMNRYGNWYCDYVVSFDQDVAADSVILAGAYGNMMATILVGMPFQGNNVTKQYLLSSMGFGLSYQGVVDFVDPFVCTAINISRENIGKTINVSLVIWPESGNRDTDRIVVTTIPYTFTEANLSAIKIPIENMGLVPFHHVSTGFDEKSGLVCSGTGNYNVNFVSQEAPGPHFSPAFTTVNVGDADAETGAVEATVAITVEMDESDEPVTIAATAQVTIDNETVNTGTSGDTSAPIAADTVVKVDAVVKKAATVLDLTPAASNTIEIKVRSEEQSPVQQTIVYQVDPIAIVNNDEANPIVLSNEDLAEGAEFTFRLDVTNLAGVTKEGDTVAATHKSSDGTIYGTTLYTAKAGDNGKFYIEITTDKFSEWSLSGIDTTGAIAAVFTPAGEYVNTFATLQAAVDAAVAGGTVAIFAGNNIDAGSETVNINKSLTIVGQGKDETVLNFKDMTGPKSAFKVTANNVTIKELTINQPSTDSSAAHIEIPRGGGSTAGYRVDYSNITLSGLKFTNGHNAISVAGENVTIEQCEFAACGGNGILIYSLRGNSAIKDNLFNMPSNVKTSAIYYNAPTNPLDHENYDSIGTLRITGNTYNGDTVKYQCFFEFTSDAGSCVTNLALIISSNVVKRASNKAIVFGNCNLGNSFSAIEINYNAFIDTVATRPVLRRDDSDTTTIIIDAKYNYWGSVEPNFTGTKPLITADEPGQLINTEYEPYYITYNSTTGELSDLRPLPPVAQIIRDNGATTNTYETLTNAIAAAQSGETIVLLADIEVSSKVSLDKAGTYTIDGDGRTISMKSGATFTGEGALIFGPAGTTTGNIADIPNKTYTLQNVTITGFDAEILRIEGCGLTLDNVTFDHNNIAKSLGRGYHLVRVANANVAIQNSTFSNNAITGTTDGRGIYVDETSQFTLSNSLFDSNTVNGSGVVTISNGSNHSVINNTFEDNTVTSQGNGAVLYLSKTATVTGNLFKENSVTEGTASGKEGVIVVGSGGVNSVINNNAFVDNTLGTTTSHYATIYTGADCNVNGNYWGDGAAAEIEDHKDVYDSGTHMIANSTYAESYAVNENGRGVTVTLYVPPVAQIVTNAGATTNKYESLAAAVEAAASGVTIELIADDDVSLTGGARLTIDKPLTITGEVDANGKPLYTIYGTADQTGSNDIFITGSGTVTLSNLNVEGFGYNHGTDPAHAPIYVSAHFSGTVNIDNVNISKFNRGGVFLYGGAFNVTDCYIDCANSRSGAFTKGIEIKGTATGTIADTVIVNMERASKDWASAGIEVYGNGTITVDGCTILTDGGGHTPVKATYGISSSRVGEHDPSGGSLLVTDCYIDVSNAALSVEDDDEYGPVNNYSIVVDGEDTYFSNYIATWSAGSSITINEGEFSEDVYADAGTINITGGKFSKFAPDTNTGVIAISGGIFDDDPSDYCVAGYVSTDNTDSSTKDAYPYAVVPAVASITIDDETTYYATFEDAIDDAELSDDEITIVVINYNAETMVAPEGWQFLTEGNVTTLVKREVAQNVQTSEKYFTLAAALDAAQDGQTVKLLANAAQNDGIIFDKAGAGVILDLDGKTFTVNTGANCNNRAFRIDNGTLTVTNGSIVAAGSGTTSSNGAGCYGAFRVEKDGTLNVQDATLSNSRPWGLNVKICGGRANLERVTINSSYGGGIEVTEANLGALSQPGYAELTDCTFTQTGYFDHCSTALSVSGGSELVVNSGTYTSENYGLYVFSSGGKITVKGGTITGENKAAVMAAMDTNTYPAYTGAVQISGGRFKGELNVTSPASMSISGGVFSSQIDANYCAVGYEVVANADEATNEVYPWTVAHVNTGYIVEDEDGEGYAVIPAVEVDSDWIKENVNPAGATATTEEIEAALNTPDPTTNLKKWEAYVLNQEEPIKIESVGDAGALTTTLGDAKEGTGLTVTYSLVSVDGESETDGDASADKSFALEKAKDGSLETGLYKVRVHFKPTGDASASEITVDSENTVGVLKTQPTGQFVVVPVPFKELGGDDAPVKVASYIRSGLATGDTLHVYNGSNYDSWTYNGTSWDKTTNMTVNDENTASSSESEEPSVATLSRGTAAILRRAAGNTAPLVFVGDYTGAAEEQTIAAGWNLVASPSLEAFEPATKFTSGKIQIPGDGLPKNYTFKNGKWGYSGVVDTPYGKMPGRIEVDTLPAGTGFWYFSDSQQQVEW